MASIPISVFSQIAGYIGSGINLHARARVGIGISYRF
jgi:hypothetical protein